MVPAYKQNSVKNGKDVLVECNQYQSKIQMLAETVNDIKVNNSFWIGCVQNKQYGRKML